MPLKSASIPAPFFSPAASGSTGSCAVQDAYKTMFLFAGVDSHYHWQGSPPTQPWATQGCRLLRQTESSLSPMAQHPWSRRAAGASGGCGAEQGPRNAGPGFKCCLYLCLVVSLGLVTSNLSFLTWEGGVKNCHLTRMFKEFKQGKSPMRRQACEVTQELS